VRAVRVREFGPPEVLVAGEAPEPVAGTGEVVIDVEYANITFVETQLRAGRPPYPGMLPTLPVILGNGVGGVVAHTGPGVDDRLAGRHVVTSLTGRGGYAERVVASAERMVEVPDGLAMRDAVALLADGRTALMLMRRAQPSAGETVLVEAAAGGVGTLLVQLARNAGARVVALAGGERKLAVARDLGADVAIDYRSTGWPQQVRDAVSDVDMVFDGVGGTVGRAAFELLRGGGRFCPFGMASGSATAVSQHDAEQRGVTVLGFGAASPEELLELTRAAISEAAAGRVRPVIGQEFALEDAADAHAAIEARATIGKTLLVAKRVRASDSEPAGGDLRVRASDSEPAGGDR
jgi:NADPH:quinone reductase